MQKKIKKILKLNIKGGSATPAPPIGPICGAAGINIMDFCKKFNICTQDKLGKLLPVSVHVYNDKSFDFFVKNPHVSVQLMEVSGLKKGSKEPNRSKVAKITWDQIRNIAENKMPDLNCFVMSSAISMVAGTARSMGIEIISTSTDLNS